MFAPWKKSYDQPRQHIKKQRHDFTNGSPSSHTTVFPVVIYGCESWKIKKLSAKELMILNCGIGEDSRVPWTARRSNQSILKEISPGCSLEGMMLKLKLQYLGHVMRRVDSLEKTLMLGGIGGRRKNGTTEVEMAGWHH